MKNFTFILFALCISFSTTAQTITVNPNPFNETDEITITISDFDPMVEWGVADIYIWSWYSDIDDNDAGDSPTNGEWTDSNEVQKLTANGDGTYSYTMTPTTFYNDTGIGRIGFLFKADDGSDGKQTENTLLEVGETLSTSNFERNATGLNMAPNPTSSAFSFAEKVQDVSVFSTTGVLIKSFNGDFEKGAKFNVNELNTGLYIVQAQNKEGNTSVTRLIKQ